MSVLDYEQVQPKTSDKPLPGHKLGVFGSRKNVGEIAAAMKALAESAVKMLRMQPLVWHPGRPEGELGPPPKQQTACPCRAARGSRMGGWHPSQLVWIPTLGHCAVGRRGVGPEVPKLPEPHKALWCWVLPSCSSCLKTSPGAPQDTHSRKPGLCFCSLCGPNWIWHW